MSTTIRLGPRSGIGDGYGAKLPLEHDLENPIVVDASALGPCHPMLLVRLQVFLDWHSLAGHQLEVRPPTDVEVARHLADMGLRTPEQLGGHGLPRPVSKPDVVIPLRRLTSYLDVEEVANRAERVLTAQVANLAAWGDAIHMAIGELCDNGLIHGRNELGVYVAADRVTEPRREFRLAIVDLGIGIPEHIRSQHPEWQDDTAAIARAIERGVTGTGDPHRGNGFAEVFDVAVDNQLVRALSAATVDIRSSKGRVRVELVGGQTNVSTPDIGRSRRGTWITYTVTSV